MLIDYRVQLREYLLQISRAITAQLNLDDVLGLVLEAATRILARTTQIHENTDIKIISKLTELPQIIANFQE